MKILVTGAAGLVGSHLADTLARDHDVLALKRSDLDISDRDAVNRYVSAVKPSLIVNCAVIQVDESEQNPAKSQAVNVEGPRFLAAAASRLDAELVHFSSQYAFDGEPVGRSPYTIEDEPRPVNVYGRTKVASEEAVRDADVVVTVTNSAEPVLKRKWLKDGVHINAVGACFPNARELDSATVAASSFFVDRRESAENEAGDYLLALKEGVIAADHIRGEIGELLVGETSGRTSAEEITVFESLGLAVEDLFAAEYLVRRAREAGRGTTVDF